MQDGNGKPIFLASVERDELSSVVMASPDDALKKFDSQYSDEDDRIVLNVGGVRHETHLTTLRKIEKTRLSRLAEQHLFIGKDVYFFDRHPAVFNSIIDFYRTGELHVPLEVCGAVVKRELDYWQINENHIKSCCWRNYRSYIENKRILDSFNHSIVKQQMSIKTDDLEGWEKLRTRVWLVLEYPRTSKIAMAFETSEILVAQDTLLIMAHSSIYYSTVNLLSDHHKDESYAVYKTGGSLIQECYGIVSLLFVITSILGFCLETLPDLRPQSVTLMVNQTGQCNGKNVTTNTAMIPNAALNYLDYTCTAFFTAELITRFVFSPNKLRFVRSAMNVIDLLALVPLYMQLILNSEEFKFCFTNERLVFEIMFILRIVRMFRIFHLVKHYQALQILVYALKASLQELLMLLIFLLIGMLVFATMIYYAERKNATTPGDNFTTIPVGFWWAIITMTTVGYGDVFPITPIGYVVGTACSVSGVLMVALTIPVISNNFTLFYTHVRSRGGKRQSQDNLADINSDILVHSEDGATVYENARRTSNGSIIMNEKSFSLRKPSNGSAVTADAYPNGKCGHNGDVRYGRMINEPVPQYTGSTSMTNTAMKCEESEIILTRSGSVKAHSDDGVMYSGPEIVVEGDDLEQICFIPNGIQFTKQTHRYDSMQKCHSKNYRPPLQKQSQLGDGDIPL